jgi:hypothetical protein
VIPAAGLELGFLLSNADEDDHDRALIRRSLSRTPAERFAHRQSAAQEIKTLWHGAKAIAKWLSRTSARSFEFSIGTTFAMS